MTLIKALQRIPDHRGERGKRHPLWLILVVIVMGNLAGYQGNRPLQEFSRRYGSHIVHLLDIEVNSLPSYSTFRRIHLELNFMALSSAFAEWMQQEVEGAMTSTQLTASASLSPWPIAMAKLAFPIW